MRVEEERGRIGVCFERMEAEAEAAAAFEEEEEEEEEECTMRGVGRGGKWTWNLAI
jgi:hypothetical protein